MDSDITVEEQNEQNKQFNNNISKNIEKLIESSNSEIFSKKHKVWIIRGFYIKNYITTDDNNNQNMLIQYINNYIKFYYIYIYIYLDIQDKCINYRN